MDIELKDVHVGQVIKRRLEELNMSKSEFGRKIGVPQQHVNRILERETMETKKLVNVCRALDINIFALFCSSVPSIHAYLAAVSTAGDAHNTIGDSATIAQLEYKKAENIGLLNELNQCKQMIEVLKSQLEDKNSIINLLKGDK